MLRPTDAVTAKRGLDPNCQRLRPNLPIAGDHFIASFPGYQSLYELGKSRGAELSPWTARETEHGLCFAIEVCGPCTPTGKGEGTRDSGLL
jgi:hypothetical protein